MSSGRLLPEDETPEDIRVIAKVRLFARKENSSSMHFVCVRCPIVRAAPSPAVSPSLHTSSAPCRARGHIDRAVRWALQPRVMGEIKNT